MFWLISKYPYVAIIFVITTGCGFIPRQEGITYMSTNPMPISTNTCSPTKVNNSITPINTPTISSQTYPTLPTYSSNTFILSENIQGCASKIKTKSSGNFDGNDRDPEINIIDNAIYYSRALHHLCCRQVEITKEIVKNNIILYENWSGEGCKCPCFSEIEAIIENVPAGKYTVYVYEVGTEPLYQTPMEKKLIISEEVVIK
jgi:hypothetical protein